jgi:hypothetical protein
MKALWHFSCLLLHTVLSWARKYVNAFANMKLREWSRLERLPEREVERSIEQREREGESKLQEGFAF